MEKEIEQELGSGDLEVSAFGHLVVYVERGTNGILKAKFYSFRIQVLFFENIV